MDTRVTGQGNNTKPVEQGLRSAGKTVKGETAKGLKEPPTLPPRILRDPSPLPQLSDSESKTKKSNPKKLKKTNKQMEIQIEPPPIPPKKKPPPISQKKKPPPIPPKQKPPPIPPKQKPPPLSPKKKPPPLSPKKKPPPLSAKTSSGKRVRREQEEILKERFDLTPEQAENPLILNSINKILTHCELNGIDPIKARYDPPNMGDFDKRDPTCPEIKMTVEKEGGTNETYIFKILPHGIFEVRRSD